MNNKVRNVKTDSLFLFFCFVSIFLWSTINKTGYLSGVVFTISIIVTIIIVEMFPLRSNDFEIYENKSAFFLFLFLEIILQLLIFILNKYFGLNNMTGGKADISHIRLIYLLITGTLFFSYLLNINFKDFYWGMTFKELLLIIAIYVAYIVINRISGMKAYDVVFDEEHIKTFMLKFIYDCFYPGIFEETVYRGFLISGLKGLGLNESKCNVVQALFFGASHVNSWGSGSFIFLLHTAFQSLIGYLFGKLYFKTKSLTPCIILHGLFNTI